MEQRKDTFIGLASHELRTPLTNLKGYTQLLGRQWVGTEHPQARMLTRMEAQIEQLSRLIEDLLDLSKIEAGTVTFTGEPVDGEAQVREVVRQFQQSTSEYQIRITGSAPGTLICDRQRLAQVLNNLLTNAVKYSPKPSTSSFISPRPPSP